MTDDRTSGRLTPELASQFLDQSEAEAFTKLHRETLKRAAHRGEDVGRLIVCGRVLFDRDRLAAWLRRHATLAAA